VFGIIILITLLMISLIYISNIMWSIFDFFHYLC
jgi:hypothetical protein